MTDTIAETLRSAYQWIVENVVFINMLLALLIVFFQRREPKNVWTWLLVLYFLPVLGFVLYLLLGQNYRKNKMFRMKEIEGEVKSIVRRQEESIYRKELKLRNPDMERFKDLMLYNLNASQSVLTDDNDIRIFADGKEKFRTLIEEMERAEKYIHMQYYIIKNDELWQAIREVLIRKAAEGVEVRVLYDSMGCRAMKKREWKKLKEAGIEIAEFFPAILGNLQLRVNYRNHRKIVVIDGRIGFVGGFNVGREYLGLDKKFGYWRDTHLCIEGSAVTTLALRFVLDWNYAAKENLFLKDSLFEIPVFERHGSDPVQIISSGPDSKNEEIRDNYLKLINKARDHIYLQTPYFIPDESIRDALYLAAKSGVDVRIMIPCKPDHPLVYWATYSYIGDMIDAGAKCYVYNNGFLHAKGIMVDGLVSCYGTANMDIRSFELNFEVNATIYSAETTKKLEDIFRNDIRSSTQVTRKIYDQRSLIVRIKEQFSRPFSPLL